MTNRFSLTLGAMFLLSGAALAQGPEGGFGGPPPGGFGGGQQGGFGGGPQGGGFGGQRGGGPGGMMMNRTVTAASLSLRTMLTYLDLSDAQAVKIALAKEDAMESMRGPMGGGRGQQGGQRGGNNNAGDQKAVSAINALLSSAQKSRLATLVKAVAALQKEGVRPDAAAKLKLSDEQLTKLAQGASKSDVLSEDQVAVAAEFSMPQGGPGGQGGFGGGGFPGGEGGPGGPPPGGFGGGN